MDQCAVSIWSLSGQQQTAIDDAWIEVILDLSAYAGDTISVTWRGTRGAGFTSDMAIDDIGITVLPPADYVVTAFTSPANPVCYDHQRLSLRWRLLTLDRIRSLLMY